MSEEILNFSCFETEVSAVLNKLFLLQYHLLKCATDTLEHEDLSQTWLCLIDTSYTDNRSASFDL